jgi:hypothetical protein
MKDRIMKRYLVSALVIGILAAITAADVYAAPAQGVGNRYCQIDGATSPPTFRCFATRAEMWGTIRNVQPGHILSNAMRPNGNILDTVLWDGYNETGNQAQIINFDCSNTSAINLSDSGWVDKTVSVTAWACDTITLHEFSGGGGAQEQEIGTTNLTPAFRNVAASFTYP